MAHECERCAHRLICEWCVENSTFRMPETDGKCGMYLPDEEKREAMRVTGEDIKTYKKMKRRAWIVLFAYAAAMLIYPFAAMTILDFPIWVVGWIATLVGWGFMVPSQSALIWAIRDKIDEGTMDDEEREQ